MNEKNYEYLVNQLMHTGFGDTMNDDLRKNMEKQTNEFTLHLERSYGDDKANATLYFKKSDQFEMYFFNKYDLQLTKQNRQNDLKQTFYNDRGITLKEAYNLLDGRPVNKMQIDKEGEKYNAWLQLDFTKTSQSGNYEFKQFHQNYGFDLEKTLSKLPLKELGNDKFKADLIRSLERGNLQSAILQVNGKEEKVFLTPNVAFKSINAFDSNMQKIKLNDLVQHAKQQLSNNASVQQKNTDKQPVQRETKQRNEKSTQKKTRVHKIS